MILVFGQYGQLASAFREHKSEFPMRFIGSGELDLLQPGAAEKQIQETDPRLVINCAAYTAVDRAETELVANTRLNSDLPGEIGRACSKLDIPVIHFSTDYVFDGNGDLAQSETSPTHPQNAYGVSKLQGEKNLVESGCSFHIYRISWVYSAYGTNFLKTMLRIGAERSELKIVSDQIGSPMSAHAIADLIIKTAVPQLLGSGTKIQKIFNLSTEPYVSWYEFAEAIFSEAKVQGFDIKADRVIPIPSSEYPTPAKRPFNSRLDGSKFQSEFGLKLPPWRESLKECLQKLKSEEVMT